MAKTGDHDHGNDLDPLGCDPIGDDEGEARNDQLAGALDLAWSAEMGMRAKTKRGFTQGRRHLRRGGGVSLVDVGKDLAKIIEGILEPEDLHPLRSEGLRSA